MQLFFDFLSKYTKVQHEEINDMLSIMHFSSHPKNELLHKQESIPQRAAFILKGCVRAYYVDSYGVEQTIAFKLENQPLVSFEYFVKQIPVQLNVVTLEPTEMVSTGRQDFLDFLQRYPKYEGVLRDILGYYLTVQNEQMKLMRISSPSERYEYLLKMHPEIVHRVPQKFIASYLGMAEETLSRIRAKKMSQRIS